MTKLSHVAEDEQSPCETVQPLAADAEEADPRASHFDTAHLEHDLTERTVRGATITLAAQGVKFGIRLLETVVLARLLAPTDFGLIAMATAVIGFVAMFADAGLSMATVQRDTITHEQVSALFWINAGLSLLLMVLTAGLAPLLAWLYQEPRLIGITIALGTSFLFVGLTAQHMALLKRQMRFGALATYEMLGMGGGVATAVVLALYFDLGYWSLVGMHIARPLMQMALVWTICDWRPTLPQRAPHLRSMLAFGGFLSGSQFLIYVRRNLDYVLLGAVLGPAAVGLYQRAFQILTLPAQQVNGPLSQVVVPALSRLQSHPAKYRSLYRGAIFCMASLSMPLAAFALIASHEVVALALGEQWLAAVPIFRALAPAALAATLNVAGGWVYLSTGRTDRQFRANLVLTMVVGVSLALGVRWGGIGVALAYSLSTGAALLPHFAYAMRGSPVSLGDLLGATWRPGAASMLAALAAGAVAAMGWVQYDVGRFVLMSLVFTTTYALAWWLLATPEHHPREMRRFLRAQGA